jgi:hypothetical protein
MSVVSQQQDVQGSVARTWVLELGGVLGAIHIARITTWDSHWVNQRWGPGIFISNKFPGDPDTAALAFKRRWHWYTDDGTVQWSSQKSLQEAVKNPSLTWPYLRPINEEFGSISPGISIEKIFSGNFNDLIILWTTNTWKERLCVW